MSHTDDPINHAPPDTVTAAAAYALLTPHPVPGHGGSITMPPLPDDALTRQAIHARLSLIAARLELMLLEKVDRLAVRGLVSDGDLKNFAHVLQFLSRLTAIRKTLDAYLHNAPDAPDPSTLQSELIRLTGSADVPSAPTSADQSASPSQSPGTAGGPVRNASTCQSAPPSPNSQPTTHNSQPPLPSPHSALHDLHSPCPSPQAPRPLSVHDVHAVHACPTLPLDAIEPTLTHIHSALTSPDSPLASPNSPHAPCPSPDDDRRAAVEFVTR